MKCEDFVCCGHDICPDFDEEGNQLNMRCVCGVSIPLYSMYSLCVNCLYDPPPGCFPDWENDGCGDVDWDF